MSYALESYYQLPFLFIHFNKAPVKQTLELKTIMHNL